MVNKFSILVFLFLISGCALQDHNPIPSNTSSTNTVQVNATETIGNNTNQTTMETVKTILLPADNLAIYILHTEKKGSYIVNHNNNSMLINAQGSSDILRLIKLIHNIGIDRLDYFILTNSNEENIEGAPSIILREKPFNLIHSGIPSTSQIYLQYNLIYPNSTVMPRDNIMLFGDSTLNFIVPYDDGFPLNIKDDSFLVKLNYGGFSTLFATDCEIDCESRIRDANLQSTILVSNGLCNSLSTTFLAQVSPEIVVFSGKNICEETLNRVQSAEINVLKTSDNDIVIVSDGIEYEVI